MVIMIVKYEICERSTHDGYISLGINNKYNMIGAEIIGEFCFSSVRDRTFFWTMLVTKIAESVSNNFLDFFD